MTEGREPFATRDELYAASDAAWARLQGILDGAGGAEIHGRGSNWTARDEYAHHARWLDRSLGWLRSRLDGVAPPPNEYDHEDVLNERWQAEDRALSVEAAKARCAAARGALLDYVRDLPEARLDRRTMMTASDDPVWHLDAHVAFIVAGLLKDDAELWARTVVALDASPDDASHQEGEPWTVRDVWAHLGRWMARSADVVEAHLAGTPLEPITDFDSINAEWQAQDAGLSRSEARSGAFAAHERIRRLMESLSPTVWDGTAYRSLRANTSEHYLEHLEYMGIDTSRA
jgi:hypothetical protein